MHGKANDGIETPEHFSFESKQNDIIVKILSIS